MKNKVDKEMVVEFEGYSKRDKAPVAGRALVLSSMGNSFVIYWNGQVRHLGGSGKDIKLHKGQVQQLDISLKVRRAVYRVVTLEDIVGDTWGQVLLSGQLKANQPFSVSKPYNGRAIVVTDQTLKFVFARIADVETLQVIPQETIRRVWEDRKATQNKLEQLQEAKQQTPDWYQREELQAEIESQKYELEILERRYNKIEIKAWRYLLDMGLKTQVLFGLVHLLSGATEEYSPVELFFSGRLSIRVLPDL